MAIPGYTIDKLTDQTDEWLIAVYNRVVKIKRDDAKLQAMLHRYKDKALRDFNVRGSTDVKEFVPAMSVNGIMKLKGVKYTRKGKE